MTKRILTITGPSCSGKTTLTRELEKTNLFKGTTGFTTRPPRPGEVEGVSYIFLTEAQALDLVEQDLLADHVYFNGCHYGITLANLEEIWSSGKIPVAILEPHGLVQFRDKFWESLYSVSLDAPLEVLIRRYLDRVSEGNLDYHAKRISSIVEEKDWVDDYEFDANFDFCNEETLSEIVDFLVKELKGHSHD